MKVKLTKTPTFSEYNWKTGKTYMANKVKLIDGREAIEVHYPGQAGGSIFPADWFEIVA